MIAATRDRRSRRSRAVLLLCIFAVGAALLLTRCAMQAPQRSGQIPSEGRIGPCTVTRVVDGDTVDVACPTFSDRIRLLRIDTPERGGWGYRQAADALRKLVQGKEVYLAFEEPGVPARGGYGRLLAYLYVGDVNLNVEMVRQGWSPFWTKYGEGRLADEFQEAEEAARQAGRGIWSAP